MWQFMVTGHIDQVQLGVPLSLKAWFFRTAPVVSTMSVTCSFYTDPGNVTAAQTAITVFGNLCM
jgi:hypothetical protein